MNSKVTTNSQLSTTVLKKQKHKQAYNQNKNRITEMEISEYGERENWGKFTGNKKHNW